ncbi:MAG TPA: biosynthetic peptidoglycan transglycosylase, partial [Kofleriaceae bacterium]|nr:biosynthetic peptidoglycan transglycosylase [Kofleriaceae bacterium]
LLRKARRIYVATALVAVGAPVSSAWWVGRKTDALADHLAARAGIPARIGAIDADLTGTIRLDDVALGDLVRADSVEASVAMSSLVDGQLGADEIHVAGPRIDVRVDADGDSDLARLARRLLHRPVGAADRGGDRDGRLRRIVVSSGTLSARIAGLGELVAEQVEIVPDAGGVRVITGAIRLDGRAGPLAIELAFARGAVELALPHLGFRRALAVGGTGAVAADRAAHPVGLRDVAVGRLAPGGPLELRAAVDDDGIARPLAIDVQPRDLAVAIRGDRIPLGALAGVAPRGLELAAAHASGAIAVHRDAGRLMIDLDGAVDGVAIDHRVLAAAPVPLAGAVHASIAVSAEAIAVPRASIELGAARWALSGWLRRGAPASGQLDLSLATAACSDLLAALPAELRGPLDGMVLGGSFGARLRLAVDLAAPDGDGVSLTASITDACRAVAEPPAADVARLATAGDQVFPDGSRARIGPGEPGWAGLAGLPGHVAGAFLSAEDARFYDHAGFDLDQIGRSLEIDLREHRLARGGSTISQQLVKNAFLSQRRSFDRKLQEAILTWRLEARLDKRQILERYLNLIELGPRVFGLTAAARHWFAAAPRELTVRQAAFLAALTSEPSSMSRRVRRAGGLDPDSAARLEVVLRAMRRDGVIDAGELEAARVAGLRFAPAALTQER